MSNLAFADDTKIWTYDDVQKLDSNNRYEVINGKLYMLASPSAIHQILSGEIFCQIKEYLKGKTCEVYSAPMDVDFEKKIGKSTNFTQPDIFILCDQSKKGRNQIIGAPDFIIEILSPGDEEKDRFEKLNLYLTNKVREYWMIDPKRGIIETYVLKEENYIYKQYKIADKVKVSIFDGLKIDISKEYKENEYLLKEESEEYITDFPISDILREYIYEHFNNLFKIEEYEAQILDIILNYRAIDSWTSGELFKLGGFGRCFDIINGVLLYKPV